jgi:hypothetical protein
MTITAASGYLASADSARFPGPRPREEQMTQLATLSYDRDATGELNELLDAVVNHGELIPGRSSQESIDMAYAAMAIAVVRPHGNADMDWASRNSRVVAVAAPAATAIALALSVAVDIRVLSAMPHGVGH